MFIQQKMMAAPNADANQKTMMYGFAITTGRSLLKVTNTGSADLVPAPNAIFAPCILNARRWFLRRNPAREAQEWIMTAAIASIIIPKP